MTETRYTYLRRVLPDILLIQDDIWAAQREPNDSRYFLVSAIMRVRRLLEDLERAEKAI